MDNLKNPQPDWFEFCQIRPYLLVGDLGPHWNRRDTWFEAQDDRECDDGESYRFLLALSLRLCAMHALLAGN